MSARNALILAAILWLGPTPLRAQDKVYTSLTPERMEQLLKSMNLEYKKTPSASSEGVIFYDFARNKRNIRLSYFRGKDIMLDLLLQDFPLETINRWNVQSKFSRASLHKDEKGAFTALESNLDLLGGVTDGTVKHFFKTFGEEIVAFDKFVAAPAVVPTLPPGDDTVLPKVTSDKLEAILKVLNLTYKKSPLKNEGSFSYQYESKNFKISLFNFGGKDLMLDAVFKKMPLEKVNHYNFDRKFIRVVSYNQNGQEYTSLETNMDCSAGVSENMIRHFLLTFEEEVQLFADYVSKNVGS